jgi:hypothetical protein
VPFSHDIPPKTPPQSRWNYVEDPPIVRSTHHTLIEEHHRIISSPALSTRKSIPNLNLASTSHRPSSATTTTASTPVTQSSCPSSTSATHSAIESQRQHRFQRRRPNSSSSSTPSLTTPSPPLLSYQHFKDNTNYLSLVNDVTSSYHPPKLIPPFYTGLSLTTSSTSTPPLPATRSSSSSSLTRTGGGYINSLTGLPAGANKFVQQHTITHQPPHQRDLFEYPSNPSFSRDSLSASRSSSSAAALATGITPPLTSSTSATATRRIGVGKVMNQPGVSRNDARLHKCVDDLIVHLCLCDTNEERQALKMEFTNTVRKYGKSTKVSKDKYGRRC